MNTSTFYDLEVMLKYMAVSLQLSPIYIAQLYQVDPYGNFILAGRVTEPPVVSFVNATTGTDGSLSLSLSLSLFFWPFTILTFFFFLSIAWIRYTYVVNPTCSPFNDSCPYSAPEYFVTTESYHALLRPWYIECSTGLRSWTDLYFFQQTGLPGTTGVAPLIVNGNPDFVSAVDISLSTIGTFLQNVTT